MSLSEMSLIKRLFSGVAVAALAVTLVACSDEKKETAKAPETTQTTTEESASSTPATSTGTTTETATIPTTTTTTTTTETAQTPATETKTAEVPSAEGDVDMAEVLKAGALPEMALGEANAPVTIVEYMSMTCPHCAALPRTTFDAIKTKYVDTGKVRFICANSRSIRAPLPRPSCWRAASRRPAELTIMPPRFPDVLHAEAAAEPGPRRRMASEAMLQIVQARRFYTGELPMPA
jgi:hypothetical protein